MDMTCACRESTTFSQFELLALFQCAFDALAQRPHAVSHTAVELGLAVASLGDHGAEVMRRHYGDAIVTEHLAAVADLAHAAIEEFSGIEQRRAFLVRTGDHVFLFHDAHADARRFRLAHVPCSRVFRRPIMASTRVRTCSFLCMSAARSPARDSWLARTSRFSSFRCSRIATSSSMRFASRVSSSSSCVLVVSLMSGTIEPRSLAGQL